MMTQLDKPISADDKMDSPLWSLLWWAAQCPKRMHEWPHILERHGSPLLEKYAAREEEFAAAYRTVIRARADEVVRYCDEIGIFGITPGYVRECPIAVALAVDAHLGHEKPDDAFMELEVAVDILHAGPWRLFKDWCGFQWFWLWRWMKGNA